jgi:hypothetical protein
MDFKSRATEVMPSRQIATPRCRSRGHVRPDKESRDDESCECTRASVREMASPNSVKHAEI